MQAWSIAKGKTCLRLRQPLRFQARSRLLLASCTNHISVPPGAEAFTVMPVDFPAVATAAAVHTTVRVPVPADVPATASDAVSFTAELLVVGEPECEKQPRIAESEQTTTGKQKFCFIHSTSGDIDAWSVAAKPCYRCYHTRCYL